jgi:hypothetical protein
MRRLAVTRFSACLLLVLATLLPADISAQTPPLATSASVGQPSFKAIDADRNGRLSLDEVLAYAQKDSSLVTPFRVADVDTNGDGVLSVEEQKKAGLTGFAQFGAVNLKELDANGDGYITREEIDAYFARRHRAAFAQADHDKSGDLTPREFVLYRF